MLRIVEIKKHNSLYSLSQDYLLFDSNEMKDSEALHNLLCFTNPGDEYTISFNNVEQEN